ncbi:uncharacterized protein Z519_04608 [Cladophialophora bantiana CBS 173.52]|uniref:Heterokaryon incompatibility domain-containing protein n=1 Tax=Cladophialophora bantiana (strain ATCC 10958 / CBS 173.52 / CDC B-1940 / NIH 8579) TaxID=1442370 RepID=A0A0D2G7M5_CLAB1|nr:uncharacterized protein Z519_04608 [Cladophialophora bantiana CBS 173.52]KIW94632.1 hypothetical protein Z519_04608 [Cladophialophora bantiana CBS 173.52]
MRLINVQTLQIEDFSLKLVPPYAILSHTWENDEITFQTWCSPWQWPLLRMRDNKITRTCRLAKEHRLGYVWIDTCCIDKTNSAELSEAINSMYRWYQEASICFVYLSDLPDTADLHTGFARCRWHKRGWTLQELIAPRRVEFYDQAWRPRGSKKEHQELLSKCTGIPAPVLSGERRLDACSVRDRLSWASHRETTKLEDAAYCLLGIFDVHMPLIYGEGQNASYRLQEAIKSRYKQRSESAQTHTTQHSHSTTCRSGAKSPTLAMCVPPELIISCFKADLYPANLMDPKNARQLAPHREMPESAIGYLCDDDLSSVHVRFADLHANRGNYSYRNVCDEVGLAEQLGDESALMPPGEVITRADPRSRFIFLVASSQANALRITKRMLFRVFTHHQVPAQHLNLLFLFTQRNTLTGVRHDSFWGQLAFGKPLPGLEAPDLGRSGRHYEISFNLKGADLANVGFRDPARDWSIYNAAIYHKLDTVHGTTVWIITTPEGHLSHSVTKATFDSDDIERRSSGTPAESYISSLKVHTTLARWAGESWWAYFQCLGELVQNKALLSPDFLKTVQSYGERVSEAVAALETNLRILQALRTFYEKLIVHKEFPFAHEVVQATLDFYSELQDIIRDFEGLISWGARLTSLARERKGLVIHDKPHYAVKANKRSDKGAEEVVTLRILTMVTLVYLPATFVSTFFGADVIRWDPQYGAGSYSPQVLWRWLVITGPLTFITLVAAFGAYWLSMRSRHREL